jgi:hypothetical protein
MLRDAFAHDIGRFDPEGALSSYPVMNRQLGFTLGEQEMESVRFLPTQVHGTLDYLVGLALIVAPNIFQFADIGKAAVFVPRVLGVGLIVFSLMTRYEWGVYKPTSLPYHLMVDLVAALFLALSPFLFGFSNKALNAWLPHVVVGNAVVVVVLVSRTQPDKAMTTRGTTA